MIEPKNNESTLRITRDVDQPAGGWVFKVQETGVTLTAASAFSLKSKVRMHMAANQITPPSPFQPWFEDALCKQMGLGAPFCGAQEVELSELAKNLSWGTISRFVKTMWQWAKQDRFTFVPAEVADKRAEICIGCPHNITLGGCGGCLGILKRIAEVKKERAVAREEELHNCDVCGCDLKLKVWAADSVLDAAESSDPPPYPDWCWRKAPVSGEQNGHADDDVDGEQSHDDEPTHEQNQ